MIFRAKRLKNGEELTVLVEDLGIARNRITIVTKFTVNGRNRYGHTDRAMFERLGQLARDYTDHQVLRSMGIDPETLRPAH